MTELGPVAWPPAPIRTERLVLREPEARDRAACIELLASAEVGTYLGGPRPRDELEREMPEVPERRPGLFIVDLGGAMIGQVIVRRVVGHGPAAAAGQAELGYMFLPRAWGFGYAAEACAAALGWLAGVLPGEPVVLFTQTANTRSMRLAAKLGFTEVERYEAYGAEQWFGRRLPVTPPVEIRVAEEADAAEIARIHMASRSATMPYLPPQKRGHEQVTRWVRDVLLRQCRTWVAVREGEIMGYAALDGDMLEDLYLRPDVRRQGIGTLLLDEVRRYSPDGMSLHVFQQNTEARAFYEHHGFTVFDTSDGDRNMENLPDMTLRWTPRPRP